MCRRQGLLEKETGIRSKWDMEITVVIWVRVGKENGKCLAPPDPSFVACPALSSPFGSAGAALSQVEAVGCPQCGCGSHQG